MHTVGEAMTSHVVTVSPDSPVTVAARMMRDSGVSGLPVVDRAGRVVGILTEADLLHRVVLPDLAESKGKASRRKRGSQDDEPGSRVRDVMSREVVGVRREDPLAKAARLMETARVRRLVVVGDGFTLEGIISRSDIVAALARPDSDIEGEIRSRVIGALLGLEPEEVTVSVRDGIVTLAGAVTSRREAVRLQRLAGRVLGVSRVDSSVTWHKDDLGFVGRITEFFSGQRDPSGEPESADDDPSDNKELE